VKRRENQSTMILRKASLLAVMLIVSVPAFSQGCALCYTQAASAGARIIQALKSGILILIIPPTLMSLGVIGICYRKRNQFQESDHTTKADQTW
jgi:hypothetical protein